MMNWIKKLRKQGACPKAIDWASEYDSAQAAWSACERGDWMLWAWAKNCGKRGSKSHRQLVLACVEIARTSVKNEEIKKVIQKSLDTTERWARGEKRVSLNDVKNAAWAARSDRYAAGAADAADAADAAWGYCCLSYCLGCWCYCCLSYCLGCLCYCWDKRMF